MAVLGLSLTVELDGRPIEESPFVRALSAPDVRGFSFHLDDSANYQVGLPPVRDLELVTGLIMQTTEQVTVRLNGQATGGIIVNAGGILALTGTRLTVLPLWSILNTSTRRAQIRGVLAGR